MLKIALTGADGLIGSRIIELLKNDFQFIPLPQSKMDITRKDQVWKNIIDLDFDLFLHLAAYTNVDGAEQEKELAYKINVEGAENVFEVVTAKQKKFIYISTDFVFEGKKQDYDEDFTPNPISYYGKTKYEGERVLGGAAMIVRLSYPYRARFDQKKDFVRNIKFALEQKKTLTMVTDSRITLTFIDDIVYGLKYLFNNYSTGIFHLVGADSLSPYKAGKLIAETFNLDTSLIQPITYEEYYKNRAKRPQYSQIKSKKNNFWKMKSFREGLDAVKSQM